MEKYCTGERVFTPTSQRTEQIHSKGLISRSRTKGRGKKEGCQEGVPSRKAAKGFGRKKSAAHAQRPFGDAEADKSGRNIGVQGKREVVSVAYHLDGLWGNPYRPRHLHQMRLANTNNWCRKKEREKGCQKEGTGNPLSGYAGGRSYICSSRGQVTNFSAELIKNTSKRL